MRTNFVIIALQLGLIATCCAATSSQFSFALPKVLGGETPQSAGCCEHHVLANNKTSANVKLPLFLGLGTQKSGTTTLAWMLSLHPNLSLGKNKELHYMDRNSQNPEAFVQYLKRWKSNKEAMENGKKIEDGISHFEVTPSYLWVPIAACRAKHHFPDMKFVVIFRDPAERAYSEFTMVRNQCFKKNGLECPWPKRSFYDVASMGIESLKIRNCSFDTGEPKKTWNDCFKCMAMDYTARKYCLHRTFLYRNGPHEGDMMCVDFGEELVSRGLYGAQIAWWFQFYKPEQFIFFSSGDFYQNPVKALNRIADFVGVDVPFTEEIIKPALTKSLNTGSYRFEDPRKDEAIAVLREFYKKPNQEMYQLLKENGHTFTPFEKPEEPEGSHGSQEPPTESEEEKKDVQKQEEGGKKQDSAAAKSEEKSEASEDMRRLRVLGEEGDNLSGTAKEVYKMHHTNWTYTVQVCIFSIVLLVLVREIGKRNRLQAKNKLGVMAVRD